MNCKPSKLESFYFTTSPKESFCFIEIEAFIFYLCIVFQNNILNKILKKQTQVTTPKKGDLKWQKLSL